MLYKYSHHLAVTQAPATKAKSLVKAMAFIGHVLGVTSAIESIRSPRLKGSTWAQHAGKRIAEGRSPFYRGAGVPASGCCRGSEGSD